MGYLQDMKLHDMESYGHSHVGFPIAQNLTTVGDYLNCCHEMPLSHQGKLY